MNVVSSISGTLSFAAFSWEHPVALPVHNVNNLKDIQLKLRGLPSSLGPTMGTGPEDIRIYLGDSHLTQAFVDSIQASLAIDVGSNNSLQEEYAIQYAKGLDTWLATAEKLGRAFPGDLSKEREKVNELKTVKEVDVLFARLGDRSFGWSGHLHLFRHLHTSVQVPPTSMRDVIARHNNSNGTSLELAHFATRPLTVSSGPCRLFDDDWNPRQHLPSGAIHFAFEVIFENPNDRLISELREDVNQLRTDHDALKKTLLDRLTQIDKRLIKIRKEISPFGNIQREQGKISEVLKGLAEDIDRNQIHVVNQEAELKVLKRKIDELKDLVERLG
ncbi:MAG: hypothetical protein KJ725_06265 [Gammaproteobacteria bacterium]|nr:hypothetical protein [Gammaproteobacteria bacterium]